MVLFAPVTAQAAEAWQRPSQPPANQALQAVLPGPGEKGEWVLASPDGVFKGPERGPWEKFWVEEPSGRVRQLLSFSQVPGSIFMISEKGIYECSLEEKNCRRFFRVSGRESAEPLSFTVDAGNPDHWLAGTEKGLEESDDRGRTWFRFTHFRRDPVSVLAFFENRLVLGAGHLLFVSQDGAHFKPVFSSLRQTRTAEDLLEENFSGDETFRAPSFHTLVVSSKNKKAWLAGASGVFESADLGMSWKPMPVSGLGSIDVTSLAWSEKAGRLFAGTSRGIFVYDSAKNTWKEDSAGMDPGRVLGLALLSAGNSETLAAISPGGFFFYPLLPDGVKTAELKDFPLGEVFRKLTLLEPGAWEVQKQAMRFANVKNGKIKRWQAESRAAALLPNVSFGKDFSTGNNIDIDRGGTSDPDRFIFGPADTDRGWDFDVSWDLGDFIFSSDQTSIDSREKLMVELRNDILAEVTRIYYERRRLQMEACLKPSADLAEHMDKIMRIDELTSLLDGFTGNYFSKKLERVYFYNPDLRELWEYRESETEISRPLP